MNLRISLFIILHLSGVVYSQTQPSAEFLFNKKDIRDKVSGLEARLVNVAFTEDRFGNSDHALHLFGNANSYVSLGNSPSLKPVKGSISMWVNVENALWFGTGYKTNPFILTKSSELDDFFEAYAIYYMVETRKLIALVTKDSTNQLILSSKKEFSHQKWHHLVLTFDLDTCSFFIDGELQARFRKGFDVKYLASDSVLLGITANKKNNRFFSGSIDDVSFYHKVLLPAEVKALYQAPNPNQNARFLAGLKFAGLLLLFASLVYLFIRWQLNRKLRRYKETLKLQTRLLETELRVNRALMNPHFIFNSLNSIQNLILNNHNDQANMYLLKFSKLMRKILESNTSENISLADEVDILQRYLELEQLRFQEDFIYRILVNPALKANQIRIPIMMVQPFVENAIWHGLISKDGERILEVRFDALDENYLLCVVEDNGIGRNERENVLREKKSLATIFVRSRLELINKIYNLKCDLKIIDKPNHEGTIVELLLPIVK